MSKALGAQKRLSLRCRIDMAAALRSGDEAAVAKIHGELTRVNNAYTALLNNDISESQFWDRIQSVRNNTSTKK